ncbi:MAG: HXXEE domain-containing protein [Anaerolineaceae bacterium]|nr:HXXEE domain-containing protein [Anaerolineaceae bacterium]
MKKSVFPWLYLGLGFAQAAHSIEEVLTGLWRNMTVVTGALHERLAAMPHLNWSGEGFAAANIAIVALLIGLSPFVFLKLPWAWKVAQVVALIETINGIGHITAALLSGAYFPGCISGIALLAISIPLWAVPSIRRIPHGAD